MRAASRLLVIAATAAVIAWLPLQLSDYNRMQGASVAVYFIAILGLDILTGYAGQISIGNGAFMAIGGYTTAILTVHHGWTDVTTIPLAALAGFACGVVVGLPALRLSGAYLALLTFAVALAVPQIALNYSGFTGGNQGLPLPAHSGLWLYAVSWAASAILLVLAWLVLRGRTGRAFRAVRDSEIAAAASGVSLSIHKALAFGISAAYAAVAGSLLVLVNSFINPQMFGLTLSLYILIGAAVGGLGSLWGVLVGAIFVQLLPSGLQSTQVFHAAESVPVIFGVFLVVVMLVFPGGATQVLRIAGGVTRRVTRRRAAPEV
ncbi:MAG TPA: branched-chain amino acid ABC transporter permease [Gaiellaceae bacterium]|jgi:branched-chain amino acid transport system permease protein|nr:branched-chain amino acid ABC transporter permease [Gaiellaceae bacterium]